MKNTTMMPAIQSKTARHSGSRSIYLSVDLDSVF